MMIDEDGYLYLRPPEDSIEIEETVLKNKLLAIVDKHSKWPDRYNYKMADWATELMGDAEILDEEIEHKISQKYSIKNSKIVIKPIKYTAMSIYCEILDTLFYAFTSKIAFADIPIIKNFLNTPLGQEKQAWQQWEEYWEHKKEKEEKERLQHLENSLI